MTKYPNLELSYHQWTVADYHKLAETGLLSEKRVELIAGEIIDMSPIGKLHAAAVNKLTQLLHQLIGEAGIVSVQNPITIHDFSEPEPDLAILKPNDSFYADQLPSASDVLLVVEVADTTLAKDRQVKIPLYSEAGIPEYWIINLNEAVLERYTEARNGEYALRRLYRKGDTLSSELLGEVPIDAILL
jgi:Uma2 family endonuclease